MPPRFMADTSAVARLRSTSVDERLSPLIAAGDVATCSPLELEVLFSARSAADLRLTRERRAALPRVSMEQRDFDRAADVMEELATQGLHHAVGIPDLLIAAAAERTRLTLLHYDSDFETIASVTGQPTEWVVPSGSVP